MDTVNKFEWLKGAIIDIVTSSCDDAEDFDLMMEIGNVIKEIETEYNEKSDAALRYKELWYGLTKRERELKDKIKELEVIVEKMKGE